MFRRPMLSLIVIGIATSAASADAATLCANASGSVFVRAACNPNETPLDPVALGLVGPRGPAGPQGPQGVIGAQGPEGPRGIQGPAGVSGWELVRAPALDIAGGQSRVAIAQCPAGKKPIGGGFIINGPRTWIVIEDEPRVDASFNENGWGTALDNLGTSPVRLFVTAICAIVP